MKQYLFSGLVCAEKGEAAPVGTHQCMVSSKFSKYTFLYLQKHRITKPQHLWLSSKTYQSTFPQRWELNWFHPCVSNGFITSKQTSFHLQTQGSHSPDLSKFSDICTQKHTNFPDFPGRLEPCEDQPQCGHVANTKFCVLLSQIVFCPPEQCTLTGESVVFSDCFLVPPPQKIWIFWPENPQTVSTQNPPIYMHRRASVLLCLSQGDKAHVNFKK